MKKGLFNRRIPTLFALLTLIVAIVISLALIQSGVFYIGKASQDSVPRNFLVTNTSDTYFTVVFGTTAPSEAVVTMSDKQTGNSIILDDRDKKTGAKNKYYSHHITAQNLKPNTKYSFKIISGGKEYTGPEYTASTRSIISSPPPAQNPLFGKVLLPNGALGSDSVVTAKTGSSLLVSAVTDAKGEFIIPTNSLRTGNGTDYFKVQLDSIFSINVFRQDLIASATSTFQLAQNLPPLTLSQEYVFSDEDTAPEEESNGFNFTQDVSGGQTVSITVPDEDESFIDSRPRFSGTSYPNSSVSIKISGHTTQQVLARADGSWTFTPSESIAQGKQQITITVQEDGGQLVSETKNFTVFPSGSQVTESATASATPTITPSPTLQPSPTIQPSPTPTQTPTPSPTVQISATPLPSPTVQASLTPSATPLPTIYSTPTPIPSIAPPGGEQNTIVLTGISMFLIIAGALLLFAL